MLQPAACQIIEWLRQIALTFRLAPLGEDTFLPGITLEPGGLIIDLDPLLAGISPVAFARIVRCPLRRGD